MAAITTATKVVTEQPVRGTKRSYYKATIAYSVITGTAAQLDSTTLNVPAPVVGGSIQVIGIALGGATTFTLDLYSAELATAKTAKVATKAVSATTDLVLDIHGVAVTTANANNVVIPAGAWILDLVLTTGNPTSGTLTAVVLFELLD